MQPCEAFGGDVRIPGNTKWQLSYHAASVANGETGQQ